MERTSVLVSIALLFIYQLNQVEGQTPETTEELLATVEVLTERLNALQDTVKDLSTQTMMQQFFTEERIRTEGSSGVKVVRGMDKGPNSFYEHSHIGKSFNAIHDHSNQRWTVGMGEIVAVLNGVEFRTRHNDYKLVMPSTNDTSYHATQPIPFPQVPTEVTDKISVDEEIDEMREWFKAFATQNKTHRDYTQYFKPVLCYLEGTWTLDKKLTEPFESDRHQIDASTWFELQGLVRYSSYTGSKSRLENYAYLPTAIMSVNTTTGLPNYAQWNYRILCQPTNRDIPLKYLKKDDDVAFRLKKGMTFEQIENHRAQRFHLYEFDEPQPLRTSLIDEIFYNIPGKDNIPAMLDESSFGEDMFLMDGKTPLNTGYYHRFFKFGSPGAMGLSTTARCFNDAHCWVAQTTQERVAPLTYTSRIGCKKKTVWENGVKKKIKVCPTKEIRYSYAIPLEIIYLTPLLTWNPYDLAIYPKDKKTSPVFADGRNGRPNKPYNGTNPLYYYLTPVEFFTGKRDRSDKADTVRGAVHVLDQNGEVRKTTAAGTRIVLPSIEGVGQVRLRYPIAPVHGEGSSVWKELNAIKTQVTHRDTVPTTAYTFEMAITTTPLGDHNHEFMMSTATYDKLINEGAQATVTTTENQGHTHTLIVKYIASRKRFEYILCDGENPCFDKHSKIVYRTN